MGVTFCILLTDIRGSPRCVNRWAYIVSMCSPFLFFVLAVCFMIFSIHGSTNLIVKSTLVTLFPVLVMHILPCAPSTESSISLRTLTLANSQRIHICSKPIARTSRMHAIQPNATTYDRLHQRCNHSNTSILIWV